MTDLTDDILHACETHDVDRLRSALGSGWDPRTLIRDKPPLLWLIEMYTRSDRFPACVRLLLEHGAEFDDSRLVPILLDDPDAVRTALRHDPTLIDQRVTLPCAFTPLAEVSLLHVAAEFGHGRVAEVLLEYGHAVDAPAGIDADGLGGHTPLFHTVNAHADRPAALRALLLTAGARTAHHIAGLTWGRGFAWETTFFDLTPISYAQLGLLPQMHRREEDIHATVRQMLTAARRSIPVMDNVPNRYLAGKS